MWCTVGDAEGEIVPAFLGGWLEITQVWSFAAFAAAVVTPESHAKDDSEAKSNNNGRYGVQGASTTDHKLCLPVQSKQAFRNHGGYDDGFREESWSTASLSCVLGCVYGTPEHVTEVVT